MQSWGTTSRFDQRDTGKEPSKSGVIGLIAAALGIDRENWDLLQPVTKLKMGVRHDRPGVLRKDYQTAGCSASDTMIKANGSQSKDGVVSERFYLADAAFLVGLEGDELEFLERLHNSLHNPHWLLGLGRKSYLPAEPVYLTDGLREEHLRQALITYPWLGRGTPPNLLLLSLESTERNGRMVMDQLRSSFAERRFASRYVQSEWVELPKEGIHASS